MIPSEEDIRALHWKYAPNQKVFDLVHGHGEIVTEIALWAAGNVKDQEVDTEILKAAALLHDIGTYVLFTDEGTVPNGRLYPQHAIFGAKILADEGVDERIWRAVETHVLMGLTAEEIKDRPWPLPARDYLPQTIEGELLCYADRFHSKHPIFNRYETFLARLQKDLPLQAEKFESMAKRFGVPDVEELAKKYNQSIA